MRTFILLLATAAIPASASVTYTLQGGFSVTTPDFIPNLVPQDESMPGLNYIIFTRAELSSCTFPDSARLYCVGAQIGYDTVLNTAYFASDILDTFESATVPGQSVSVNTDLLHTGTFGRVTITQGNDPVTAGPEPSTFAIALAGLSALFFRWKTRK